MKNNTCAILACSLALCGGAVAAAEPAVFKLDTAHVSLVFERSSEGLWRLPYIGAKIAAPADIIASEGGRIVYHGDTKHPAYDVYGTPFKVMDVNKFGGMAVKHADGVLVSDLVAEGAAPEEVPAEPGVRHIVLRQADRAHPLFKVAQHFKADEASDVIETWIEFENGESGAVEFLRMDSFAWTMPRMAGAYSVHTLASWWGCEAQLSAAPLVRSQTIAINSRNGVRGAWDANPSFILSLGDDLGEDTGAAFAGVLAWSGAWRMNFRRDYGDIVSIVAGPDNGNGAYVLDAGAKLTTPVFAFTYTQGGCGQVARNFHRWARTRWLPHRRTPREILLNSWEGSYLTFKEKTLTDMMDGVKEMGGEMFVVDDGWFGEGEEARDHDVPPTATGRGEGGKCDAGLGDWQVNRRKLPRGLEYLTAEAAKRGLKFGIWVEPEMANLRSKLVKAHPDWPTQVAGRKSIYGRGGNQVVLDFTNPAVVDNLYGQLHALYSTPGISYIKWDANANIFNPGSTYLGAAKQGNLWFDYTRGVYDLLARLQKAHPDIVTQACSSGGGHMEYGFLHYCDEFWASDDSDARERIFIQWGALQFYPASALAAHVTASPNHQTHRVTPLKFRFDVAMSARLGFELRPSELTQVEVEFSKRCVADYKRLRGVVQDGELYRLVSPYNSDYASLMYVAQDRSRAVVYIWGLNRGVLQKNLPAIVHLKGLDPASRYRVREINRWPGAAAHVNADGKTVGGDALMNFGLEPKLANGDYDSCVIELIRE